MVVTGIDANKLAALAFESPNGIEPASFFGEMRVEPSTKSLEILETTGLSENNE